MFGFDAVDFVDAIHGWAGGQACPPAGPPYGCPGVIEATDDGGRSWRAQYQGPFAPAEIQFTDASHGFALATAQSCAASPGGPCPVAILATTDVGRTWRVVQSGLTNLRDFSWVDGSLGWAAVEGCPRSDPAKGSCTGAIAVSTDGGLVFRDQLTTARPVVAITHLGEHLWAVEAAPGESGAVAVLASPDAGAHWSVLATVPTAGYDFDTQTSAQIVFTGPSEGWMTLYEPSTCAMHGCTVSDLFHSTDGGGHWAAVAIPGPAQATGDGCGPSGQPALAVVPGGTVLATRSSGLGACAPPATSLYDVARPGTPLVHAWDLEGVSAFSFPSGGLGWAVAGATVIHTTDGGRDWTQQLPAPSPTVDVSFVDPEHGWGTGLASDSGAVLRTDDGGRSWQPLATLAGGVHQVAAVSTSAAVVAVESLPTTAWSLERTTDSGAHWTTLYQLPGQQSVEALALRGSRATMITSAGSAAWWGPGGTPPASTYQSSDGGRTWGPGRPVPDPVRLTSVSFSDPDHAWALEPTTTPTGASSSDLLATEDGGRTWSMVTQVLASFVPGPHAVDRVGDRSGWVWIAKPPASAGAGPALRLLHTTDGGRTWRDYELPTAMAMAPPPDQSHVASLYFLDAEHGWFVTSAGTWVARYGGTNWSPPPA